MMILRRRRRTDHKTPECGHTVWEAHVAPGIVRGQKDIINVCNVNNPCVPMRSAVKIIPNDRSCSNSFQWLCHLFRMAHRDETTKCYLRQLRAFTQYHILGVNRSTIISLKSKKTAHRSPAYSTLSLSHHLWRVILAQGPLMQQSVTLIRTDTQLYLAEAESMC